MNDSVLALYGGRPVREEFLVYGAPDIGDEEIKAVVACLKSGWLSTGPRVTAFEASLRKYIGAKFAVATNSCTAALHLALLSQGIQPGDEVITTPMTFGATANVIEHTGAKVVLADVKKNSFHIDPQEVERRITKKTKAIIPVHFAGFPCDMIEINRIAEEHNLVVIEDAAHAIGSKYNHEMIGAGNNIVCFSFYVTKNITSAEGGMLTLSDRKTAELIRAYSLHGMSHGAWQRYSKVNQLHYEIIFPGYKYNMPDISASIAAEQLKKIEQFIAKRRKIADIYFAELKNLPGLILPDFLRNETNGVRSSWHLFPVLVDLQAIRASRDEIMHALIAENIGVATHYRAIFEQEYYKRKYCFVAEDYPNAKYISDRVFSIPLQTKMDEKDINDVVTAFKKVLKHFS